MLAVTYTSDVCFSGRRCYCPTADCQSAFSTFFRRKHKYRAGRPGTGFGEREFIFDRRCVNDARFKWNER